MAKFPEGLGIPCGFTLLPDKSTPTYELVFQALKDKVGPRMELQYIIVDFELAVLSALGTIFPAIEVTGCLFHFRKAIWHNIGQMELQSLFHQDPEFQEWVYMLYSLCYVPT